jgi:hypothetical protein
MIINQTDDWQGIWERKGAQVQDNALDLEQLLRLNGYDTGHGHVEVEAWTSYAENVVALFGAHSGHSIYEVGCGAGATSVVVRDQEVRGYANASGRFNVFAETS